MEELEQANTTVEIASDVTMLLELLKPHMNSLSLSMNAADILEVARIEGDVKVVRGWEWRYKRRDSKNARAPKCLRESN